MKKLTLITCLLLTSCGQPPQLETSPGSALPKGMFYTCKERDMSARCSLWSNESEYCINPKGFDEQDGIVLCSDIKDGKYIAPKNSK